VWKRLVEMSRETWTHVSGAQLPLVRLAVDTGFATQEVYAFVRASRDTRIVPVKGIRTGAMGGAALVGSPTAVDLTTGGKKLRRGIKVFAVAVGMAKLELYNNLRKSATVDEATGEIIYPEGYVHLPKIDAEYLQQLCAEQLITRRDRNGFPVREWQKMRERNEGLDCFDAHTEVLTYAGWKLFKDVGFGDTLATVNLSTDQIEYQSPQCLIAKPYVGSMLTVAGTRLNFSVTPNHRMVTFRKVFDRCSRRWNFDVPAQITLAQDLTIHHTIKIRSQWQGRTTSVVTIPASIKASKRQVIEIQRRVDARDMAALLGWYVAEGHSRLVAAASSIQRGVALSQVKPEGCQAITQLLDRLPWAWHWSGHSALITSKQLYDYIQRECPGLHHEKCVPQWIKDADTGVIEAFVCAAVAGDGWIQKGFRTYATTSPRLADDMAELFFKLGGSPSITRRQAQSWHIRGSSGTDLLPQFHVRENNGRKSAALDGKHRQFMVKERAYNGMVYCATVPNGTVVVRRAGKMMIAGNCAIYARAGAALAGLDRFEERHWRELERQLLLTPEGDDAEIHHDPPDPQHESQANKATDSGGFVVSELAATTTPTNNSRNATRAKRAVSRSRWLGR
jgi:hypothetical protein